MDHSIVLYLVSPSGEFLDFFTQSMEVKDIVDKIAHYKDVYEQNLKDIASGSKKALEEEEKAWGVVCKGSCGAFVVSFEWNHLLEMY